VYASIIGPFVQQFEPGAWAKELIEPARRLGHRRLAQLYAMAARCLAAPLFDEAVQYAEAALQTIDEKRFDPVPFGLASEFGLVYLMRGEGDRWISLCRRMISEGEGPHILPRVHLAMTLAMTGALEEALDVSEDLRYAERVTDNPALICWALIGYGFVRIETDPASAFEAHRLAASIAAETGNRLLETYHMTNVSRLAARQGDAAETLDLLTKAIRNYLDSGNYFMLPQPMAMLADYFDRQGYHETSATLSGFATTSQATTYLPEIETAISHLRDVLGADVYASLAAHGAAMTPAAIANYAFEQIDRVRAELS
jgi:hypothetical protein